jgi:L-cysteine S-thiosulfotransferase
MRIIASLFALALGIAPAAAQQSAPTNADSTVKAAFPTTPADWAARLTPDDTMAQCSAQRNSPPKAVADQIQKREQATIVYPPDNNFIGDWRKGEALAQSGYGLRFTDYPARQANGGNCYACHQITKSEVSFGTLGPSLGNYGKIRDFDAADAKALYEKIYNSNAVFACSTMPRFGANKILTIEQIKDIVALLMSRDSPVNTGK